MRSAVWGVFLVAASAALACEPTDEFQLTAEARSPRPTALGVGGPASGSVDLTLGVTAPPGAVGLSLRVLNASRTEWAGAARVDEATVRVPLGRPGIHEILIEATATVDGRAIRTETVVRVPFGVPDPIVDDGATATFAMEPGR